LLNVKGKYALASRDNLILAANRVKGNWWRLYVIDTKDPKHRVIAAGAIPTLGEDPRLGLLDSRGAVIEISREVTTYWRLAPIPKEDDVARLSELLGNASNTERPDLVNMGRRVMLGVEGTSPIKSIAAAGEEIRVTCELALFRALHASDDNTPDATEGAPGAQSACSNGTQPNFASWLLSADSASTPEGLAKSDDKDTRSAALRDWPPALSRVLVAASRGDPRALWLLRGIYSRAIDGDADQSTISRVAAALKSQVDDLDSIFVETNKVAGADITEARNVQSADPIDHLLRAVHPPTEIDVARIKDSVIQLSVGERLLAVAGLPEQAMLVNARRSWLAHKLPRDVAIGVARRQMLGARQADSRLSR
jgi:hypothetical protein